MVVTRHTHAPIRSGFLDTEAKSHVKAETRIFRRKPNVGPPRQAERGVVSLEGKFKAGCIFLHLAILMMLFVDDPT